MRCNYAKSVTPASQLAVHPQSKHRKWMNFMRARNSKSISLIEDCSLKYCFISPKSNGSLFHPNKTRGKKMVGTILPLGSNSLTNYLIPGVAFPKKEQAEQLCLRSGTHSLAMARTLSQARQAGSCRMSANSVWAERSMWVCLL